MKQRRNTISHVVIGASIILIVIRIGLLVFQNKSQFMQRFDVGQAEKQYNASQWNVSQNDAVDKLLDEWAIKNGYTGWANYTDSTGNKTIIERQKEKVIEAKKKQGISDSTLYTYVGYKYLTGTSPHLLNPEHPPLAKYMIGMSVMVFGNAALGSLIAGILVLILVCVVMYEHTRSLVLSVGTSSIIAWFSLFGDQIVHGPQLELYQLMFFLAFFYAHTRWLKINKTFYFLIASGLLGCMLSTKTLLPFLALMSAYIFIVHLITISDRKRAIISACMLLAGSGLVFTATYAYYFVHGGNVRSFIGLQKYIFLFYRTSSIPLFEFMGNYLRLIFTGSWKFWDAARTVSSYSEWNGTWPVVFSIGMGIVLKQMKRLQPLTVFILLYNIFLFITPMFPRYLVLLFVPLIMDSVMYFSAHKS
jgi:predicted membrane-bound dolichyl-phosphate-mannose-protein mannosyltransferase